MAMPSPKKSSIAAITRVEELNPGPRRILRAAGHTSSRGTNSRMKIRGRDDNKRVVVPMAQTQAANVKPIKRLTTPSCMCGITDDVLWRATRRAEEHYTKDKLSTRRGAVHSIGWLSTMSGLR
jgi:hypothetical protein